MRTLDRFGTRWAAGAAVLLIVAAPCARADVTMHEQTTFDFTILKAHGTATNSTTSDKQRRDLDLHCEGLWALLCGNQESTEIVRLDRDLSWERHPKKKHY